MAQAISSSSHSAGSPLKLFHWPQWKVNIASCYLEICMLVVFLLLIPSHIYYYSFHWCSLYAFPYFIEIFLFLFYFQLWLHFIILCHFLFLYSFYTAKDRRGASGKAARWALWTTVRNCHIPYKSSIAASPRWPFFINVPHSVSAKPSDTHVCAQSIIDPEITLYAYRSFKMTLHGL